MFERQQGLLPHIPNLNNEPDKNKLYSKQVNFKETEWENY